MLQKDMLLPYRTVEDNIALPMLIKGMDKKQAAEKAVEMASVPRSPGAEAVRDAGYDIQSAAEMLQSFYLRAGAGEEDAKLWQR